ncbi:MAG: S8 family serine peptidase [Acidobacteriota bacterium]
MKRGFLFFIIALFLTISIVDADFQSKNFDLDATRVKKSAKTFASATPDKNVAYRSVGNIHKIVVASHDLASINGIKSSGGMEIADYGSYKLFIANQNSLTQIESHQANRRARAQGLETAQLESQSTGAQFDLRDDYNILFLRAGKIDTTQDENFMGVEQSANADTDNLTLPLHRKEIAGEARLRLIQFAGPIKQDWLDRLQSTGVEIIGYVPNNAYLIRENADSSLLIASAINDFARRNQAFIQWEGEFKSEYKIHPALVEKLNEAEELSISIQVARARDKSDAKDLKKIQKIAQSIIFKPYAVLNLTNIKISVAANRIAEIAALKNVVNIEGWTVPVLRDERANQIITGRLKNDGKEPEGPGYMNWLQTNGLASRFNFAIDVTDSGIDRGSTATANLHRDFLDAANQSRVIYAREYTNELDASDLAGHGTINLSIAGGYNTATESAFRDSANYNYGLGIAPFASLGSSKIFKSDGRFGLSEPFSKLIAEAYTDGARISSNSWGAGTNSYTLDAQEYDSRSRDAVTSQAGNQEMVLCFAAGNGGSLTRIDSPGSGKNLISVGASESARGGGIDGCGVRDTDSDNANEIAFFSSGGPLDDGRIKPDIVAPGTHIQGAASQHPDFAGNGICGGTGAEDFWFPTNQKLYTWSSGTSHSTPIVAGAAALVRQHLLNRGEEPSVALIKALMLNTTTYMTSAEVKGNLPHPLQGWGLLNLGRAFDSAAKIFINQTHTFSDSGQEFVFSGEIKDATQPFRVTLAYSDAPGFSAFASWVNDLDLEVTINGQTFRGNNFIEDKSQPDGQANSKDNVEAVWLPAGTTGTFAVRIRAANIAGDGVPNNADLSDQDFALVIYNGEKKDVPVATLSTVNVSGGADSHLDPGEDISLQVNLKNVSLVAMNGATGTLSSSTTGITVSTATANFGNIAPNATGENTTPFIFNINRSVACGTTLQFTLEVNAPNAAVSKIPITLRVGNFQTIEVFSDSVEIDESKWTHDTGITNKKKKKKGLAIDTWSVSTKRFRTGARSWFSSNPNIQSDAHLDTIAIALPTDLKNLQLVFYHTYEFEFGSYDGGVLEISVAGGAFEDLGAKILQGKYTGEINSFLDNPLADRPAWVDGQLGAFKQVVVDLSSYAGKSVIIRFRIGADTIGKGAGWFIDDVMLRGERVTCTPAALE